jgi:hypothetical protein
LQCGWWRSVCCFSPICLFPFHLLIRFFLRRLNGWSTILYLGFGICFFFPLVIFVSEKKCIVVIDAWNFNPTMDVWKFHYVNSLWNWGMWSRSALFTHISTQLNLFLSPVFSLVCFWNY